MQQPTDIQQAEKRILEAYEATSKPTSQTSRVVLMTRTVKALKRAVLDYEAVMKDVDPDFDIYDYLSRVLGYSESHIRHFFTDTASRTQIYLDDFVKICIAIHSTEPIEAFTRETGLITERLRFSKAG